MLFRSVVLSLIAVPTILRFAGWQEVFLITGALGFIWILLWWRYYEVPQRQKRLSAAEREWITQDEKSMIPEKAVPVRWTRLLRHPQTWAYVMGKAFIDPIYWFFLFWLPSYFASAFDLNMKVLSPELMIIYLSTTVGSISGGYLSSALIRKGWPTLKARKAALLLFALLELCIFGNLWVSQAWIAVLLLSICVAAHQAWASNIFTMAADLFPVQVVSSVVGIGGMAGAVGGILFPWMIGEILDAYKAAGDLQGGYHLIFSICGCTYLLTLGVIHKLTKGKDKVSLSGLQ